jgi:hypothetical protein
MDEATYEIESHIDRTRERLGSDLRELEHRVGAATDWRTQFRARPHVFLVGAFAGGALLAAVLRPNSLGRGYDPSTESRLASVSRNTVNAQERALELWNEVKSALISVAAMRIKDYIGGVIPGVAEHFQRTEPGDTSRAANAELGRP